MTDITAKYITANKRLQFEVSGSLKEVWQQIADLEAVFGADSSCGSCGSVNIVFHFHTAQGKYDYYEMRCNDCQARLSFGQHMDGEGLWAKRQTKDGENLPGRGWHHWQGGGRDSSDPGEPPQW